MLTVVLVRMINRGEIPYLVDVGKVWRFSLKVAGLTSLGAISKGK